MFSITIVLPGNRGFDSSALPARSRAGLVRQRRRHGSPSSIQSEIGEQKVSFFFSPGFLLAAN
jgi:hypothetical protein